MQPSHAHIEHALAGDAMAGQGQLGFGDHGQIAGAASQYGHGAQGGICTRHGPSGEAAGLQVVRDGDLRQQLDHGPGLGGLHPGGQG